MTNRACLPVSETAWLDARTLLSHLLDNRIAWVLAHPEQELTARAGAPPGWLSWSACQQGEPLPYILGHWEFFGLDFEHHAPPCSSPARRPSCWWRRRLPGWMPIPKAGVRVDVGTGSGCIAVTLAKLRPELSVTACDLSGEALRLARRNAVRHAVAGRVAWLQADLLQALAGPFDLICANLPYIPTAQARGAEGSPPRAASGAGRRRRRYAPDRAIGISGAFPAGARRADAPGDRSHRRRGGIAPPGAALPGGADQLAPRPCRSGPAGEAGKSGRIIVNLTSRLVFFAYISVYLDLKHEK